EIAVRQRLHTDVFEPLDVLVRKVAAVVGTARFFAHERTASQHLGDEAQVLRVDRFVPWGVVDRAAIADRRFDSLTNLLNFGNRLLHLLAIADDADLRPHYALHAIAELEWVLATRAVERFRPALADFAGLCVWLRADGRRLTADVFRHRVPGSRAEND